MIRLPTLAAAMSLALLPLSSASAADCYPRAVKDGAKVIGTILGPFAYELWEYQGELLVQIPFEPKGDDYVPTGFTVTPFDLSSFVGEYEITGRRGKPLRRGNAHLQGILRFSAYDLNTHAGHWVNVTLDEEGIIKKARFQVPSSYRYAGQLAKLEAGWTAYRQSGRELCPAKGTPG